MNQRERTSGVVIGKASNGAKEGPTQDKGTRDTDAPNNGANEPEPYPYVFNYVYPSSYWNVVQVADQYITPGLIVDLGSGMGTIGPPLQDQGFAYLGVEMHRGALQLLEERHLPGRYCDLSDLAAVKQTLDDVGEARAFCLVDVLEHLDYPGVLLKFLSEYALTHGSPHLILSVPNVGHRDVAYNLLAGQWNETETGLLDKTHLRFFTAQTLLHLLNENGWQLVARNDFELVQSDQYNEESLLHKPTLIGDFLHYVSDTFNPDNRVNQFIWLLKPGTSADRERAGQAITISERETPPVLTKVPLFSLLVRTQGLRNDLLTETLLSIYAQDCDDYEAVLCFHKDEDLTGEREKSVRELITTLPISLQARIRMIVCTGMGRSAPLNQLIESARGDYFGFLDDDDLLFSRHVSTLKKGIEKHGTGPIFQVFAARRSVSVRREKRTLKDFGFDPRELASAQNRPAVTYPYSTDMIEPTWIMPYDPITQQYANDIPNCCFLVPRALITQTNMRFRLDFELAEDWEFLMRASQFLKLVTLPEITTAINVRNNESNTVQNAELQPGWVVAHRKRLNEQTKRPLLLEGRSAYLIFRRHIETTIKREQVEEQLTAQYAAQNAQTAALNAQATALHAENQRLIEWAHGLERTLAETQQEFQRQTAWARELEQHVQSRRRRGPFSLVRRIVRRMR